ncbi:transposase [uncultured Planococcus sp.]|uniref:transposase n=1 Tax=uncultured Planococcus sp. TaxID=337815 RepID=UPI00261FEC08|nr:transposase [uncultured Planococcus sp.]
MGRNRRIWNPDAYEHVVMRGNNRQPIFREESDIDAFIRVLAYAHEKYPFTILAYCLMTNHYHLLIRSPEVPLGKLMALINKRYSDYAKKKYNYSGYYYESRYYAGKAITHKSILAVSRYIHRNPINTLNPMVAEMKEYPHSSYRFYADASCPPYEFLDLSYMPTILPRPYSKCIAGYLMYCEEPDHPELERIGAN